MYIYSVFQQSNITFGTSGARGLVEQFTDEVCAAFTGAFLTVMREQSSVARVAIGMDRRPSSPNMAAACTAAAKAMGVEVVDYGVLPTPALALQAMADGVPAIMITGSHIPFDRNGIKFYRPEGEITKADEQAIMRVAAELPALGAIEREPVSDAAVRRYLARYAEWFTGRPLAGKRVGVYQHSAAGRDLNVQVLEALGAEAVPLGRSEDFVPVDTEAVSDEDRALARTWATEHRLDALLTTDGDGDRPLLADERGEWLRGDIVGLLCARELGVQALAVPVSCNTAIEACGAFDSVMRTRIGSPYVLAGMQELTEKYAHVAGFEANGGFLLGCAIEDGDRRLEALPTRDALLPALTLIVAAARRGQPLSSLVAGLPARYTASDRLKNFPTERSQALLAEWREDLPTMQQVLNLERNIVQVNTTDGLRVTLEDGDIVHLRPSGNAPELRCYAESSSTAKAEKRVNHVLDTLRGIVL
ncbi:phosphomannomutase [Salinicola sp. MIT1003]|uniref:phosphomannomutase n=1 Tax=Salinicola sp. MIT1003 TaxID=1882734 RepID=UPI0008DE190E|nr:phosphomannomutase [Salinicola sp. MIT1003]OHZ01202.1 phosphomannomutase [Salinicola sp. MIT1003]